MKISRIFICLSTLAALAGCGSEGDGGNSAKEFSQGIDNVPYDLKKLEISATLGSETTENSEELKKTLGEASRAKDKIQRVIKGSNFVMIMNGKESSVQVSSAGNIDHKQSVKENSPGCSLTGTSETSGVATSLKVELNWNFTALLDGKGCDENMIAKYYKFQDNEIDVFNLNSVRALLKSAELSHDEQRRIRIQLRLSGESH